MTDPLTTSPRPFRFGVVAARAPSGEAWLDHARHLEQLGYATLLVPDRIGRVLAPLPALTAAALATRTLRVGTFVLANGLRNPAILAWECATLDFLSGGRFELGLGTGVADADFRRVGIPFDGPGARVDRLAETIRQIKASFASQEQAGGSASGLSAAAPAYPPSRQQPRPPILVAGSGRRMLSLAGREADIVALGVHAQTDEADLAEKIDWVRQGAGGRFPRVELSLNLLAVLNGEPGPGVRERIRFIHGAELDQLAQSGSPLIATGTPDEMSAKLLALRDRFGFSYITVPDDSSEAFAPVIQRLQGR